ncbi:MAG: hypothetical protein RLZZ293_1183 [Pseudomonadota bacterium]|jgi:hypothetical protein
MQYFLWLYLATLSNRLRNISCLIFRSGLFVLVGEYLLLATHAKPVYYSELIHWVNLTKLVLFLAWLMMLLPSEQHIRRVLLVKRREQWFRDSSIVRLIRLAKLYLGNSNLKSNQANWYTKLITPKRLKYLYIALYLYDLYQSYKRPFSDILYLIIAYLGFICASWLYVELTATQLYYYSIIATSMKWAIAIISFIIFKVIFIPDFKVIKDIIMQIIMRVILHKLGLISLVHHLELKLKSKLQGNSSND